MAANYASQPKLLIDGSEAPKDLMEDLLELSVEESLHLPGAFTIVIRNDQGPGKTEDKLWKHQGLFAIGKKIKIGFTSSTTDNQEYSQEDKGDVIEGEITAIETEFNKDSQAPIIIRGYDVAHRLHRGRFNRSFQNVTDSDVVNQVIGEAGISAGTITSTSIVHEYVFQENQSNMEFLRERAARLGFELYVQDGKLNFREPKQDQALSLKWLQDITNFRVRVSSAEQVSSVEVRGWDYAQKRSIVTTANKEKVVTKTKSGTGSETSTKFSTQPKMIVVDQPVFSTNEAQKIAQSLCDELGGEFVYADAEAIGNPEIRPGRVIQLKEMGNYDGDYYVTETRHIFLDRKYMTEFSVRGLRAGNLLEALSSSTRLQPGQTMLVGIVSNNKDPKGWGRVRVKFPTLTEEHESNWARVVSIGAGPNRGFDCLPEVNDEVLVGFEHGDIHRPYVIGSVWNGTDPTPEKVDDSVVGGAVRLRTFKTRVGHKFQFVEEDKGTKKGFYFNTADGHNFRMNDSDKFVELQTTGGHKIRCDDSGKSITIESTGEIKITAPQKISISVGGNSIEITPSGISIKSSGTMSIQSSGTMSMQSSGSMSTSATTVSVSGSATVGITGGIVKIN
ncbi:MAG TPA: VgrG-related protein [Nostocaceae cyanobacterium]|nr:VgrG-related protein [Nostocaceae cyanobacterium]